MSNSTPWLRLPVQLAVTAGIVFALVGAALLAGSQGRAEAFDRVATQPRVQPGGTERGAGVAEHVLEGRWRVNYDEPWFTGSLVYDLREEDDGIKGYLVEIVDENGRSMSANSLIFELRRWDGAKGEGIYSMEYEGDRYEAECDIELQSTGRLRVLYSYYGHDGDETWTRVEGRDQ